MSLRQILSLVAILLLSWPGVCLSATLKPEGVTQFFVAPDEPATLRWRAEEGGLEGRAKCVIRDYWGKTTQTVEAKVTPDGAVEVTATLPQGYYDIEVAAAEQRYGVVSLPPREGLSDEFFSIDAAMSWLVRDQAIRDDLVAVLRRSGIAMARERLEWFEVNPTRGEWDWEGSRGYETLRKRYAQCDVQVLEMFHHAPEWAGRIKRYPDDLVVTAAAWQEIAARYQATWSALEVWNEPDIFYGSNLPADQYVPLVRTIAWGLTKRGFDVPIVGGVFAYANPKYMDCAARNGLLDSVDVVSFHFWGRAPEMERQVAIFRNWLRAHGRETMPLWLTECFRPWSRGPARPPVDEDAESALDITMKAVESRASGIARYFAAIYPFYEERQYNYGLMGRRATPLRSMAAYARLTSLLAHKRYLGDLKCDDPAIQRARVFADDQETVAVLYAGQPDGAATLKLDLPVQRIEGIDGRALSLVDDGSLPIGDGLIYIWLDRRSLADRLDTDTTAMRLWSLSLRDPPTPKPASPIVLRYQLDPAVVEAVSDGYCLKRKKPDKLSVTVRVFNLSDTAHRVTLKASLSQDLPRGSEAGTVELTLPPEGFADATWAFDLTDAFAQHDSLTVTVTAAGNTVGHVPPLEIDLIAKARCP